MQRLPVVLFLCLVSPLAMGAQLKGAVYSPKPGIDQRIKARGEEGVAQAFTCRVEPRKLFRRMRGDVRTHIGDFAPSPLSVLCSACRLITRPRSDSRMRAEGADGIMSKRA
jgi:hypothetical protein